MGPPRRLTRQEQQAATRERILRAAAKMFARRGYDATSLDQVVDEAGFTKGAVYSNFANKEDLFTSLLEVRCRQGLEDTRRILLGPIPAGDRMQAIGDRLTDRILDDREGTQLFLEFRMQALRNPKLRRRFLTIWQETRDAVTELVAERAQATAVPLPLEPDQLVSAAFGLIDGLAMQLLTDRRHVDHGTLGFALSLLVPSLAETSQLTPTGRTVES